MDVVELGVGLGCAAIGVVAWRAGGPWFRVAGGVLLVAGAAAIVHAVASLAS
jgi:hypothetical protein